MSEKTSLPENFREFRGLSSAEVKNREKSGAINRAGQKTSRSYAKIFATNIFTRFNLLLTILAVAVILVGGGWINSLFFLALVLNSGVGIFQEIKAKFLLDKLAILAAAKIHVIRDGKICEIATEKVVKDDVIILKIGDQIVVDGEILKSENLEIDESLLTGESDPIAKKSREKVLSGSIVVAGLGVMIAEKVGEKSYSAELARHAKKFQRASSELVDGTNKLLKWISWMLIFVAPILIIGQLRNSEFSAAVIQSVAALVGMIPEGLVLLTSAAFLLAIVKLAREKVLVQQLPAVETLARVDTLLLDKTGTLTEGKIRFDDIIYFEKNAQKAISAALSTIAFRDGSTTNDALKEKFRAKNAEKISREIAFSSARKWSAIQLEQSHKNFIFGAPEIVLKNKNHAKFLQQAREISRTGKRVLVLVEAEKFPENEKITAKVQPLALVILNEKVRKNAAKILQFFAKQNVDIKIISGDSPLTVRAVANNVGLKTEAIFDARDLPDAEKSPRKFREIVEKNNIFGRVTPQQKLKIAEILQNAGRTVAMTGDGVNDVLALKKADLGIAMNSGSAATKAVAEVVLLDNDFAHLPDVLAEGRRVIANIERVANLFVIKNIYSLILALAVTALGLSYPFLPVQMSVISTLSIGVPAFFLALAPNSRIYRPGFLRRVLCFAVPVGVIIALSMFANYYLLEAKSVPFAEISTAISLSTMALAILVLLLLARPWRAWKITLIGACAATFALLIILPTPAKFFQYQLNFDLLFATFFIEIVAGFLIISVSLLQKKFSKEQ